MDKKKNAMLSTMILGILIVVLGITYAVVVVYDDIGGVENSELVLGDIYMKYAENNSLSLENAIPSIGPDESKYFEFTISGKNTYLEKDIYYEIILNHGDEHATRTERIRDDLLKFRLVEIKDNVETIVLDDQNYDNLQNERIWVNTISKDTKTDIEITYRLYMWIGDETKIGNTLDADYDLDIWNNQVYGSIKVNVKGDLTPKTLNLTDLIKSSIAEKSCKTHVEEDGITYISGTKDCIDFNYVWYSGKLWRITAIYSDGSMQMITDNSITTIAYGSDYNFYTDKNNTSYVYQWLNEDFLDTLHNYKNIIVIDYKWNATSGNGSVNYKLPTTEAEGATLVSAPVGLLNSYEYYKSYQNTSSGSGYLHIGYYWWLLNRYSTTSENVWYINGNYGTARNMEPSGNANGIRPTIVIKSGLAASGNGTINSPYRLSDDKRDAEANKTLLNTRTSGEYVSFNEELYRIVGIENDTTKLIKADFLKDENDNIITKNVASTTIFGKDTNIKNDNYWDYYLNNTWKPSLDDNYEDMLVKGNYFVKATPGGNYKGAVCATASNTISIKNCEKTTSTWTGYVGLSRYGDMYASQQVTSGSGSTSYMWEITPYDSRYVWGINYMGGAAGFLYAGSYGARPTIHLKDTIVIKSGTGTKGNPFVVGLPN